MVQNIAKSVCGTLSVCLRKGKVKGKVLPYSFPSVGPGADPGVQAVSPQVTLSRLPGSRLPPNYTAW